MEKNGKGRKSPEKRLDDLKKASKKEITKLFYFIFFLVLKYDCIMISQDNVAPVLKKFMLSKKK